MTGGRHVSELAVPPLANDAAMFRLIGHGLDAQRTRDDHTLGLAVVAQFKLTPIAFLALLLVSGSPRKWRLLAEGIVLFLMLLAANLALFMGFWLIGQALVGRFSLREIVFLGDSPELAPPTPA